MKQYDFTRTVDGKTIYCEISPCSWMYSYYGLQVGIKFDPKDPNAATIFVHRKELKWDKTANMTAKAEQIVDEYLASKGITELVAAKEKWTKTEAKWAKEEEREIQRGQMRDADYKRKGFTHRFDGWIHPRSGDDRQVTAYCKGQPRAQDIQKLLHGCTLKTDYKVVAL